MFIDDLSVNRIGFGAPRLASDEHCWAPVTDQSAAINLLRRAIDLGVNFIDTADAYGLGTNEELIAKALHPYPNDLAISTKAGQCRPSAKQWVPLGRPEYIRQQAVSSLRRLKLDSIPVFHLHRIDPTVPFEEQVGALKQLKDEGHIQHVGLSQVTVNQIDIARRIVDITCVQNKYNLVERCSEDVLKHCETLGITFIPWPPIGECAHVEPGDFLFLTAKELGVTPAQLALAWLLHKSPHILLIPGTSSISHLNENMAAKYITLNDRDVHRLNTFGLMLERK
ncbi:aldo/keto reductase [Streptomyces sp. NPDC093595]|uniref:aldo/keto reductase n=1 Tax=Streptomyces sp. NPDC093595 TaxID=3366045 RepID=UPI003818B0EE